MFWELVQLEFGKKGKFLGSEEIQKFGTIVTFQKYSFTLSDETVVIRSKAQLNPSMCDLTAAQWGELHRLSATNSGETVETYEEDVMGKPFKSHARSTCRATARKSSSPPENPAASSSPRLDQNNGPSALHSP